MIAAVKRLDSFVMPVHRPKTVKQPLHRLSGCDSPRPYVRNEAERSPSLRKSQYNPLMFTHKVTTEDDRTRFAGLMSSSVVTIVVSESACTEVTAPHQGHDA